MATLIAIRKPPYQHLIDGSAGNNSELTQTRNRLRQPPIRDADSHPALDDLWQLKHRVIVSQFERKRQ
jgi:hypothetical protein